MASVAQSLDPTANVEVGAWVQGPDGRRDLDVIIRSSVDDRSVVIECKDWNRPIGIGFIDALESKRRDIGATVAMICSNSGFTADALRKAARVGIPVLAALIANDRRIRVVVREQVYTRIVTFTHHAPFFHHPELSDNARRVLTGSCYTREWSYQGKSVEAWVSGKLLAIAGLATQSRSFVARYTFREPVQLDFRDVTIPVSGIDIHGAFAVQWMTQVAEIGASMGMYDYLRKVVIFGPGAYQFHLTVDSETWGQPVDIDEVPPRLLIPLDKRLDPRVPVAEMTLAMFKNMPTSDPKDAPELDAFLSAEEIEDQTQQESAT